MTSSLTSTSSHHIAYEVRVYHRFEELDRDLPGWCVDDNGKDLFSTRAWFENLSRHGIEAEHERLLVVAKPRDGQPALCLPLLRRQHASASVAGGAICGLSNYYSSLYGPLGPSGQLTLAALKAIVGHLKRSIPSAAVIDLQPLDASGAFFAMWQQALREEGYATDTYFCFGNWHLPVNGRSFAEYETTIPSRLRNTYKRGRKKLDAAGPWSLKIFPEAGVELEAAIADFESIYARSWKVPEPFPMFVPGLCRALAARGWLRLGVIRVADTAIAAQLWIVKDSRALIFKLAYDEEFKRFSAGSVLSAEMMRQAIDVDGVEDVDYLTGDDSYKVDWMSDRRERKGVVGFLPTRPNGLASLLKHQLGKLRKHLTLKRKQPPVSEHRDDPADVQPPR